MTGTRDAAWFARVLGKASADVHLMVPDAELPEWYRAQMTKDLVEQAARDRARFTFIVAGWAARTPVDPEDDPDCPHLDTWFDRSVCPEPCGSMHDICSDCGQIVGHCVLDDTAAVAPSPRQRAIAELLASHDGRDDIYDPEFAPDDEVALLHPLVAAKARARYEERAAEILAVLEEVTR